LVALLLFPFAPLDDFHVFRPLRKTLVFRAFFDIGELFLPVDLVVFGLFLAFGENYPKLRSCESILAVFGHGSSISVGELTDFSGKVDVVEKMGIAALLNFSKRTIL